MTTTIHRRRFPADPEDWDFIDTEDYSPAFAAVTSRLPDGTTTVWVGQDKSAERPDGNPGLATRDPAGQITCTCGARGDCVHAEGLRQLLDGYRHE